MSPYIFHNPFTSSITNPCGQKWQKTPCRGNSWWTNDICNCLLVQKRSQNIHSVTPTCNLYHHTWLLGLLVSVGPGKLWWTLFSKHAPNKTVWLICCERTFISNTVKLKHEKLPTSFEKEKRYEVFNFYRVTFAKLKAWVQRKQGVRTV